MDDVIVIGGGLAGLAVAYTAAREGAGTTVLDRSDAGRASAAGAGILTPGTTRNANDPWWQRFAFPAVRYYPTLVEQLAEDGEIDTGYARTGLLHVAIDELEALRLDDVAATARGNLERGAPMIESVELIDGVAARGRFPPLVDLPRALYVSGACRVDGRRLMAALRRAAGKRGARFLEENVVGIEVQGGRATGVRLSGGRILAADRVVVAAGAWSDGVLSSIGIHVPVVPQRGQIAHFGFDDVETGDWPTVMGFHSHYMLTFPGGRVVAGATRENDAGFAVGATVAGVYEVLGESLRVAPGLGRAHLLELRVGLRPATPDGRPVIGAVGVDGVLVVSGHGPSGLQLAPYSGRLTARLALGLSVEDDLTPFDPARFGPAAAGSASPDVRPAAGPGPHD